MRNLLFTMFITNFEYYIAKNKPIIYTKVFAKPND